MRSEILSLCDLTGNMVLPWAKGDYRCTCVDIQHAPGLHIGDHRHIRLLGNDVRSLDGDDFGRLAMIFAFPPCTHTAASGARWFKSKGPRAASTAFGILASCLEIIEYHTCPWMIENPVSTFSTYWRKPDFTFDPCDYAGYADDPQAEAYTKKTCMWTGGGFAMPEPRRVEPVHGSLMHLMPPSKDRGNLRSATPTGFARAVFEANGILERADT